MRGRKISPTLTTEGAYHHFSPVPVRSHRDRKTRHYPLATFNPLPLSSPNTILIVVVRSQHVTLFALNILLRGATKRYVTLDHFTDLPMERSLLEKRKDSPSIQYTRVPSPLLPHRVSRGHIFFLPFLPSLPSPLSSLPSTL
jgi:hypothetical protein